MKKLNTQKNLFIDFGIFGVLSARCIKKIQARTTRETETRWATQAGFLFSADMRMVNIYYHHNKADLNAASHYDCTCLLQLSLNWIQARSMSGLFFALTPDYSKLIKSPVF